MGTRVVSGKETMDSAVQHEKTFHRFAVHLGEATASCLQRSDTIYPVHTEGSCGNGRKELAVSSPKRP